MKRFSAVLLLSALALHGAATASENDHLADTLNNEGANLYHAGRYQEAERSYARAIEIWRPQGGVSLATALNNMGALYRSIGKYAESEAQYLEALQIQTSLFGKDSIQSANVLNNLAQLYRSQGRFKEALALARKSVALTEKEDPALLDRLVTLGSVNADLGEAAEALALFQRAAQLGELKPSLLNNIAQVHILEGRFQQAEAILRRTISLWEQSVGPEHPNFAVALNNLAQTLRLQHKYAEAEPLYRQSLQILEKRVGMEHPDYARELSNLADFFHERGRDSGAIALYERSLRVLERSLGPDHPFTAKVRGNLVQVYRAEGRYMEAGNLTLARK